MNSARPWRGAEVSTVAARISSLLCSISHTQTQVRGSPCHMFKKDAIYIRSYTLHNGLTHVCELEGDA